MSVDYRLREWLTEGIAMQVLSFTYELGGIEGENCEVGRLGAESFS